MNSLHDIFYETLDSIDFDAIKDHPNILIAARFWEEERYNAARVCYKCMRFIDDMIDDHKTEHRKITPAIKKEYTIKVDNWLRMLIHSDELEPHTKGMIDTIKRFKIPSWPFKAFAGSMIYDINNDGFPTLDAFLDYARGASVAPASIFVHLNGIRKDKGGFMKPRFDVEWASTPCAIFSYVVHIIRDFQKDQINNLNYFADDILRRYGLTRADIYDFATGKPVDNRFRNLIREYYNIADHHREKTYQVIEKISPSLEPRYRLSLEIIFNLYLMVFEKIDPDKGNFTSSDLNPGPAETRERVLDTINNFLNRL